MVIPESPNDTQRSLVPLPESLYDTIPRSSTDSERTRREEGWSRERNRPLRRENPRCNDQGMDRDRRQGRDGDAGFRERGRPGVHTPFRIYVDPPCSQPLQGAPEVYFRNPDANRQQDRWGTAPQGSSRGELPYYQYLQVPEMGWIPSNIPENPHGPSGRLQNDHVEPTRYPDFQEPGPSAARRLTYPPANRFPERWRLPPGSNSQAMGRRRAQQLWKQTELVPVFEGSVEEYSRWAPLFYEFVHSQPLSTAFKFPVLQRSLSPAVRSLVMIGLDVSDVSHSIAFEHLEKYYGGTQRWTESMLEALERSTRLRANDRAGARQFLDRIEAYNSTSAPSIVSDPGHNSMMMV